MILLIAPAVLIVFAPSASSHPPTARAFDVGTATFDVVRMCSSRVHILRALGRISGSSWRDVAPRRVRARRSRVPAHVGIMNAPTENGGKPPVDWRVHWGDRAVAAASLLSICGLLVASLHHSVFSRSVAFHDRAMTASASNGNSIATIFRSAEGKSYERQAPQGRSNFRLSARIALLRCAEQRRRQFGPEFFDEGTGTVFRVDHLNQARHA